jgi:hypothetical protein
MFFMKNPAGLFVLTAAYVRDCPDKVPLSGSPGSRISENEVFPGYAAGLFTSFNTLDPASFYLS